VAIRKKVPTPEPDGPFTTEIYTSRDDLQVLPHIDKMAAIMHCARNTNDYSGVVKDPFGNVIAEFRPDIYTAAEMATRRERRKPEQESVGVVLQRQVAAAKHEVEKPKKKIIRKVR